MIFNYPKEPLKTDGDVICAEAAHLFLGKYSLEGFEHLMLLSQLRENPCNALKLLDIPMEGIFTRSECPLTGMSYYPLLPYGLLTKNPDMYWKAVSSHCRWCLDAEMFRFVTNDIYKGWVDEPMQPAEKFKLGNPIGLLLGSGYSYVRLPSDGSREWEWCTMDLDNGDRLLCVVLVWYNK